MLMNKERRRQVMMVIMDWEMDLIADETFRLFIHFSNDMCVRGYKQMMSLPP